MNKIIIACFFACAGFLSAQENLRVENSLEKVDFKEGFSLIEKPSGKISFEIDNKYNQQNAALRKIIINEIQPDMDNTAILKLEKGDIEFYLKDLKKNGFDVKAYTDASGFYFISVDLTGKNAASEALGLAKYYYVKNVLVSKSVYNELFFGNNKRVSYATRIGTITGGINHSPIDLTINKIDWTIKGGINLSPADLKIDHQAKTISGAVNYAPVEMSFKWSVESVSFLGSANRSPVEYVVDWKKGVLEGHSNYSPIRLDFDMKEAQAGESIVSVKGYANYSPVELKYNKVTGTLKGAMGYAPVDIKLVNCDLYDFLQYFFVFVRVNTL